MMLASIGTIVSTLLKTPGAVAVLGAVKKDGVRRLSKTKVGANVAMAGGIWSVLPELISQAVAGDSTAIGQIVLLVGGWLVALWGRGREG